MAEEKRYRVKMQVLDADDLAYEGWPEGELFDDAIKLAEQFDSRVSDIYIPEGMDHKVIGVLYDDGIAMVHEDVDGQLRHHETTMTEMIWLFAK